jgi:hypothetical protein
LAELFEIVVNAKHSGHRRATFRSRDSDQAMDAMPARGDDIRTEG